LHRVHEDAEVAEKRKAKALTRRSQRGRRGSGECGEQDDVPLEARNKGPQRAEKRVGKEKRAAGVGA
jgi:hypothetical protein